MRTSRLALTLAIAAIIIAVATSHSCEGARAQPSFRVGFCSDLPDTDKEHLAGQLDLDPMFVMTHIDSTSLDNLTLTGLDILILADARVEAPQASEVAAWVASGHPLLVIAGANVTAFQAVLVALAIVAPAPALSPSSGEWTVGVRVTSSPAVQGIEWGTAPAIKAMVEIPTLLGGITILEARSTDGSLPLLVRRDVGNGRVLAFSAPYAGYQNENVKLWSYTPYFWFRSLASLVGISDIPTFGSWEYAPVPNTAERAYMSFGLAGVVALVIACILLARRASKKPIRTNLRPKADGSKVPSEPGGKVAPQPGDVGGIDRWERIGLHRQISSTFLTMLTQFAISLPWLFLTVGVYSKYVQPYPMISGSTSWIGTIMGHVFIIIDMAMGSSMSKFFSHHRVRAPITALKYAQVFTWYQFLVTSAQALVIVSMATYLQPGSYIGAISYFTILASITRIPGFFGVIGSALDAMQRFDVKIKANAILGSVINQFIGWGTVLLFRAAFKDVPRFGEAFGAGVGMYLGGVFNGVFNFCIFLAIYKKLGYYAGNLFRMDFGRVEFKESFLFGFKLTVGNMWVSFTSITEMVLVSLFVANYNEELAYYNFVGHLTGLGGACSAFTSALLPAISEAHNNGKKKLVEYYLVEGLKWVYFFQAFFVGFFCAAGEGFLAIAGSQWVGATKYLYWKMLFFLWWPFAWWDDVVFQGTGHSGYNTGVWFVEQGTRLALLVFTLPAFGLIGLVYAYVPGIVAKSVVSVAIVRKKICPFKMQWAHMFLSSAASGLVVYTATALVAGLFPRGNVVAGAIVFFAGFVLGLVAHGFLSGFFGGWDKNTLAEFAAGIGMVRSTELVFSPLYKAAALGHRLSPFKERFAVGIYTAAEEEAKALTLEKVAMQA